MPAESHPSPRSYAVPLGVASRALGAVIAVLLLVGFALGAAFKDAFLPLYNLPAEAVIVLLTAPSVLLTWVFLNSSHYGRKISAPIVRFAAWPMFTLLSGLVLYLACVGWVAAISRVLVREDGTIDLSVVSAKTITDRHAHVTCKIFLELRRENRTTRLCADGLPSDGTAMAGDRVLLTGRASPLGLHIRALQVQR